jgi:hypothetical protein
MKSAGLQIDKNETRFQFTLLPGTEKICASRVAGEARVKMWARRHPMIELTEEQMQALEKQMQGPLRVMNPRTKEVFVLIRQDIYKLTSGILSGPNRNWDDPDDDDLMRCPSRGLIS